jgi:prephenate dehydratase
MAVLREGIENDPRNTTRFVVVSRSRGAGGSKMSLVYATRNEPGALHRTLEVFARRGLDLLKLESRPIEGRPWECRFHVDVEADRAAEGAVRALAALTTECRVLGTYERG